MKKILSILLCLTLLFSTLLLVACGDNNTEEPKLKLGLGLYSTASATDATADKNGAGQAIITAAAVLVDKDGKVVKAFIDCADNTASYTADGKAVAAASLQTKYEKGDAYNMVAYGHASAEWYVQADKFCALIAGKTANEIKALVTADGANTDAVISAGCTIDVVEMAKAVEKAIANAADSNATAKDTVKLGVSTNQTTSDATVDKKGSNKLETTFFAAAVNAEGKVVAASSDCVQVDFTFDTKGASAYDATKGVVSKKEAGDSYNMKTYGGAAKEWYEQADAFDAACIGKTASEIASLKKTDDNYGVESLVSAGCTILVDGFVKAASKIG